MSDGCSIYGLEGRTTWDLHQEALRDAQSCNPEVVPPKTEGSWEGSDPEDNVILPIYTYESCEHCKVHGLQEMCIHGEVEMSNIDSGFSDYEFTILASAVNKVCKKLNFAGKTIDEAYGLIYTAIGQEITLRGEKGQRLNKIVHGSFKSLKWRMTNTEWSQFMTLFRRYAFSPAEYDKLTLDELGEMKLAQVEMTNSIAAMQELANQSEQVALKLSKIEKDLDQIQGEPE